MNLEIYISSIAFSNIGSVEEMIAEAIKYELALEFSSGLPYDESMKARYTNCTVKRMPHNYFPAPKEPFVLNLASSNDEIRNKSINHCIDGLQLAKASSSPFFSAHIGYCIDPDPSELGGRLNYEYIINRELHLELFINSVNKILEETKNTDIDFLIENNVITKFNMNGGVNPLLGCDSDEILLILSKINDPRIGLLLDTAHLKVTCATLDLEVKKEVIKLKNFVKGIHHSDNDGSIDNNMKIERNYWFLPFMNKFKNIPHVVEVKDIDIPAIFSQIKILESYEL